MDSLILKEFSQKAIIQDSRNRFDVFDGSLDCVPDEIKPFYLGFNPEDVELAWKGVSIRFFPARELEQIQEEYAYLNVKFVFASSNSDPVFIDHNGVYTCVHGTDNPTWEHLADTFEEFLSKLV